MQAKSILAIDCATGPCSAALWKDGRVAAYAEDLRPVVQSARLLPMIEDVLKQAGMAYTELTAVACTTGPGSFTGIRIGLAAVRAIAYGAKIPGLGFTTLEVMAHGIGNEHETIISALNAGKGEWYYQLFSTKPNWQATMQAALATPQQALAQGPKPAQWVGNVEAPGIISAFPRADWLATLAASSDHTDNLTPFYIRPPDITLPKAKK